MTKPSFTRREVLRGLGAAATLPLIGCGDDSADPDAGTDSGSPDGGMDATFDSSFDASNPDASESMWATGGTAAMTDRETYPNPFETPPDSCLSFCASTLGPCLATSPERVDISEGWDGIPVRLALQVVTESCDPIVGSVVEVWHTNQLGVYSGDTGAICNEEEEDRMQSYFRGHLITDDEGRVDFDTVFPGWYPGRAIHIHFRILPGDYDPDPAAATSLISQLFFPDDLVESVFGVEPVYVDMGQPDTTNLTDGVVRGESNLDAYTCDISRLTDGAMMASKRIVVGEACRIGA